MDYYELRTASGETRLWPGSSPAQAVANFEAATNQKVTSWRTTWAVVR